MKLWDWNHFNANVKISWILHVLIAGKKPTGNAFRSGRDAVLLRHQKHDLLWPKGMRQKKDVQDLGEEKIPPIPAVREEQG